MSHPFGAFVVPAAHIAFLAAHPDAVHDYLEAGKPANLAEDALPADWPEAPPEFLGGWGINHRNVDLYHWILNGSAEPVSGAGSIFQTWYLPDQHSALSLDPYNERFAFPPEQLPALAALAEAVTVPAVLKAFGDWCKRQGQPWEDLDEYACQPFVDEFAHFARGLRGAIARGQGIVW